MHWVVSLVEIRDVFVSDFNSETGNRLDVPKSGLNLVLTFVLLFQIQLSPKNKSGTVSIFILTRLSHSHALGHGLQCIVTDVTGLVRIRLQSAAVVASLRRNTFILLPIDTKQSTRRFLNLHNFFTSRFIWIDPP